MRKVTIATIAVLAVAGVVAYVVLGGPLMSRDERIVEDLSNKFMEDVQYKDFRRSASYHHKLERHRIDIGRTIEKLFLLKPESLDIIDWHIISTDVDDTGTRARVHIRTKFHRLNLKKDPEEKQLILYWMKRNPDCPIGAACKTVGKTPECVTREGDVLYEPDQKMKDRDDKRPRTKDELPTDPKEKAKYKEKTYPCDPTAKDQWFMNLDSTLKEKRYNY